jgi:hypothetical protein
MPVAAPIVANAAQAVAAARVALAEAMVLKVGQVLEALVLGKAADGATTLKIGEQVVTARLPQPALVPGSTVQLQVKATGAAPQLQLLSVRPPAQPVRAAPLPITAPFVPQGQGDAIAPHPASLPQQPPAANPESAPELAAKGSQIESAPPQTAPPSPRGTAASPTIAAQTASRPAAPPASPAPLQATATPTPQPQPGTAGQPASNSQPAPAEIVPQPVTRAIPAIPSTAAPVPPEQMPQTPALAAPVARAGVAADASPPQPAAAPVPAASPAVTAAARASAPPTASPVTATPSQPAEPVANPLLLAQAARRPPANAAELPRPAPAAPPLPTTPQAPPAAPPPTPQAALAQMLPGALSRQDSAGPLLVSLAAAVQTPALLPEPVLRAALKVLAQPLVVRDGQVPARELEQAVARSGVTLEASLLRGEPQPRDAKAGLLALREALGKWLGPAGPAAPVRDPAPPPIRGLPLRAVPVEAPPLPDAARDAGRMLHDQADAAISRLKLMQLASLPDAGDAARPAPPALRMELPFLIGHELVMAQLQIGPDGTRRERREGKRGWTMRFALNYSATGEVGAEVGVLGKAVTVALWAAEPETAEAMSAALPELSGSLAAVGLTPGRVKIRAGVPTAQRRPSGRLLDSVS